jgi:hypothetical protein
MSTVSSSGVSKIVDFTQCAVHLPCGKDLHVSDVLHGSLQDCALVWLVLSVGWEGGKQRGELLDLFVNVVAAAPLNGVMRLAPLSALFIQGLNTLKG